MFIYGACGKIVVFVTTVYGRIHTYVTLLPRQNRSVARNSRYAVHGVQTQHVPVQSLVFRLTRKIKIVTSTGIAHIFIRGESSGR